MLLFIFRWEVGSCEMGKWTVMKKGNEEERERDW